MPLDPGDVQTAIRTVVEWYESPRVTQAWLKPLSVMLVDQLVPRLLRSGEMSRPFLCVNGMDSNRKGPAWAHRRLLVQNPSMRHLKHLDVYPHECLVDMNLMLGADDPYETILTAESEGYAGHGKTLANAGHASENDFLWDFYKLLMVPSPVRLMITLCSPRYQPALRARLDQLVNKYTSLPTFLPESTDLWAISFPASSMTSTDVQVMHWAPGRLGESAADCSIRAM